MAERHEAEMEALVTQEKEVADLLEARAAEVKQVRFMHVVGSDYLAWFLLCGGGVMELPVLERWALLKSRTSFFMCYPGEG